MFLVSVGGLEVAGLRHLWGFFKLALGMRKQAQNAKGNISVDLFRRGHLYFVVSVWHSPVDMKNFAHSGAHGDLMHAGSDLIKSSFNVHYQSTTLPTRDEAFEFWSKQKV